MNRKKSCISCDCKAKSSIYPFLIPILFFFVRYFHDKLFEESRPFWSFKILKYNLPYLFYLYLPKILSIILIPIIKFNTRGESDPSKQNIRLKNYHIISVNKNKKKKILLFFLISFLEVLQETSDCLLYFYQRTDRMGWLIEKRTGYIIFVPIISYFLLGHQFHRHHILGVVLGIIGAFIINFIRFYYEFCKPKEFLFHLLNGFLSLIFSLAIVMIKFIMAHFLLLSPYIFLFYDGIFCILNSLIIILIEYFVVINIKSQDKEIMAGENNHYFKNNYIEIFTIFKGQCKNFFINFFLSFFFSFIYYIIYAFTLYNYSPYLIIAVEALLPIDNDIIPYILKEKTKDDKYRKALKRTGFQSIGYIIIFFAALILNEIIVFNCFGLNKNTFKRISSRGDIDIIPLNNISPKDEFNDDDNRSDSEG